MATILFHGAEDLDCYVQSESATEIRFSVINGAWDGIYEKATQIGYPIMFPNNRRFMGGYTIEE